MAGQGWRAERRWSRLLSMPTVPAAGDPDAVKRTAVGRIVWTVTTAITRYTAHRNPQIAAGISDHVLFAIVPLFVFLGTIFGLLLQDDQRRQDVTAQLVDRFPLSPEAGVDIEGPAGGLPPPLRPRARPP